MTKVEAKQVQLALSHFGTKVKVSKQDPKGEIWKVTLPFTGQDGIEFRFYVFRGDRGKKLYLSDGGALLGALKGCGEPQLHAIQELVHTFGLQMMEDRSIMDSSDRSLSIRTMSLLQAWCSVDGVLRIWKIKQEEVKDALRSAS